MSLRQPGKDLRTTIKYQVWCYYETNDEWVMCGFFQNPDLAWEEIRRLRDDVKTPCMPDWEIVEVKTYG